MPPCNKKGPGRPRWARRLTTRKRAAQRLRPAQGQGSYKGTPYESYACADAKKFPRSSLVHAYGFQPGDIARLDNEAVDLLMNQVQTKLGQSAAA